MRLRCARNRADWLSFRDERKVADWRSDLTIVGLHARRWRRAKTMPKVERKEGQKRGQKWPKKDRKRAKKVDFGSFFRVFAARFLGKIY